MTRAELRDRVRKMLGFGWQPWVRKRSAVPGDEETVWARFDGQTREVITAGPVTPAEGELVSDIMHNRVLGKYRPGPPRSLP